MDTYKSERNYTDYQVTDHMGLVFSTHNPEIPDIVEANSINVACDVPCVRYHIERLYVQGSFGNQESAE